MGVPTCYQHPEALANTTCFRCLKAICGVCGVFEGSREYCTACVGAVRKARSVRRVVAALIVVAAIGGLAAFGRARALGTLPAAGGGEATFDYGKYAEQIAALRKSLAAEPCDRTLVIRYGDRLIEAGDHRGALKNAAAFTAKCGEYPRLWWQTYSAHQRLSEFEAAAAEATKLMQRYPDDYDYPWWRAQSWEEKGDLEKALADYRTSLALKPNLRSIPLNIISLQERLGRPCEALATLEQYFFHYPNLRVEPKLVQRKDHLNAAGSCDRYAGAGSAVVRLQPNTPVIRAEATINGVKSDFVIDTGASFVSISRAFADRLGLKVAPGGKVRMMTAAGPRDGTMAVLETVKLQQATAKNVNVVIMDDLPDGEPGLLGLSFLSRFDVKIDHRARSLTLTPHHADRVD